MVQMRKMPSTKTPNPYKGGRLGKGWYDDYILENKSIKVDEDARRTQPKQSASTR